MKRILILYKFLPQYRVEFFNRLREELLKFKIELVLIYGKNKNKNALKKDEVDLDWAKYVPNKVIKIGRLGLLWQPVLKYMRNNDLIIVEQANSLLLNYYLIISRHFLHFKLAFWGHGRNMQEHSASLRNRFKYLFIKRCDWWFAYTESVKRLLKYYHYPENKITVVQNAIDTIRLREYYEGIKKEDSEKLKRELGISGNNVAIFCGGMYPDKKLGFIVDIVKKVKLEIPDFHMIFIGCGVDSYIVDKASKENDWIHYLGPKFERERVIYFKISVIQIMPGAIGLGILDSFALETPIITTCDPYHGPEFEYLENNINGIATTSDFDEYLNAIVKTLKTKQYVQLIEGCKKSAHIYTIEKMVENFTKGVRSCLAYDNETYPLIINEISIKASNATENKICL